MRLVAKSIAINGDTYQPELHLTVVIPLELLKEDGAMDRAELIQFLGAEFLTVLENVPGAPDMTDPTPSPAPLTQAEANQVAGAFWAAVMCTSAMVVMMLGLTIPNSHWGWLVVSWLVVAPTSMALISFIMPVRPQWAVALRSIRLRRGLDR